MLALFILALCAGSPAAVGQSTQRQATAAPLWCGSCESLAEMEALTGSPLNPPDLLVDLRPTPGCEIVDESKLASDSPATCSISAALAYLDERGDPTPGDGEIVVGVVANDADPESIRCPQLGLESGRAARAPGGEGEVSLEIRNRRRERLSLVACGVTLRALDPDLPVLQIGPGEGPVQVAGIGIRGTARAGLLVRGATAPVVVRHIDARIDGGTALRIEDSVRVEVAGPGNVLEARDGLALDAVGAGLEAAFEEVRVRGGTDGGIRLRNVEGSVDLGTVEIATDGVGLLAAGVGSLLSSTGSIVVREASALHVEDTTLDLTLERVTSEGGSSPGLLLRRTSGRFTVTGDGSTELGGNGSGGTIRGKGGKDGESRGVGVLLEQASGVSLSNLRLADFDNFAVYGRNVTDVSLIASRVGGTSGNSSAADEGAIAFEELHGRALFSSVIVGGGHEDNLRVVNSSGVLDALVIEDSLVDLNDASSGNHGVLVEARAGSVLEVDIARSRFRGAAGNLVRLAASGRSRMRWTLRDNELSNAHPKVVSGGGGVTLTADGPGVQVEYAIEDNTFRDALGTALNVFGGSLGGRLVGTIAGNRIGVPGVELSGSAQGSGIQVAATGPGSHRVRIHGNQILQYNGAGLELMARGGAVLSVQATANELGWPGPYAYAGLWLDVGADEDDTASACLQLGGEGELANRLAGSGGGAGEDLAFNQTGRGGILLPGYLGPAHDADALLLYLRENNAGAPTGSLVLSPPPGKGLVGTSTPCP